MEKSKRMNRPCLCLSILLTNVTNVTEIEKKERENPYNRAESCVYVRGIIINIKTLTD